MIGLAEEIRNATRDGSVTESRVIPQVAVGLLDDAEVALPSGEEVLGGLQKYIRDIVECRGGTLLKRSQIALYDLAQGGIDSMLEARGDDFGGDLGGLDGDGPHTCSGSVDYERAV